MKVTMYMLQNIVCQFSCCQEEICKMLQQSKIKWTAYVDKEEIAYTYVI